MALDQIASEIARHPRLWRRHIQRRTTHRWSTHLVVAPTYSAWLIGWPPGVGVRLHDHGSSDSAMAVARGRLVETFLDGPEHNVAPETPEWRVLRTGSTATCEPDRIHALANLDDTLALSIHVYSPVLSKIDYFRNDAGHMVASSTEDVIDDRVSLW
jgi:quercetin dioxygenase-like cupin family protein